MNREQFSFEQSANYTLVERIVFWNTVLAEADEEQIAEWLPTICHEMDGLIDQSDLIIGETYVFSGRSSWQESTHDDRNAECEYADMVDCTEDLAQQNGEVVARTGCFKGLLAYAFEDGVMEMRYTFETATEEVADTPFRSTVNFYYTYLKPESAAILPATDHASDDKEQEVDRLALLQDQQKMLQDYSDRLSRLVRSTSFRRTGRKHQFSIVDKLIEEAQIKTGIYGQEVMVFPEYGYISNHNENGDMCYEQIPLKNLVLQGVCLGLSLLSYRDIRDKPIRRDTDLVYPRDGMSLCIELDDSCQEIIGALNIGEKPHVHIPLSNHDVEVMIRPSEVMHEILKQENNE